MSLDPYNQFRIEVFITFPGGKQWSQVVDLDPHSADCVRPIDRCSDPRVARIMGGHDPLGAKRMDEARSRLAQHIAANITDQLVKGLGSQDLINGYEQEEL